MSEANCPTESETSRQRNDSLPVHKLPILLAFILPNPILDLQPRHALELRHVVGHENEFPGKCVGSNPQVVVAYEFAAGLQLLADFSIVHRGGGVERQHGNQRGQVFQNLPRLLGL